MIRTQKKLYIVEISCNWCWSGASGGPAVGGWAAPTSDHCLITTSQLFRVHIKITLGVWHTGDPHFLWFSLFLWLNMMIGLLKGQFKSHHEECDESSLTGLLHQCGWFKGSLIAGVQRCPAVQRLQFAAEQHPQSPLFAEANPFTHVWCYSEKQPGDQRGPEQWQ